MHYISYFVTMETGDDDVFLLCTSVLITMWKDEKVIDYDGLTLNDYILILENTKHMRAPTVVFEVQF